MNIPEHFGGAGLSAVDTMQQALGVLGRVRLAQVGARPVGTRLLLKKRCLSPQWIRLQAQPDHFCDLIAGKAAPIITVEAVRRSMATGQTVALRDLI